MYLTAFCENGQVRKIFCRVSQAPTCLEGSFRLGRYICGGAEFEGRGSGFEGADVGGLAGEIVVEVGDYYAGIVAWAVWGEVVLVGRILRVVDGCGPNAVFLVLVCGDDSAAIEVVIVVVVTAGVAAFLDGVAIGLKDVPYIVS